MKNEIFLNELKEKLKKEFKYCVESNTIKFYNQELNEKDEWNYIINNGLIAHLEQVYRHNGTSENVSCKVEFIKWKNNYGRLLDRIKIKQNASERQINNFIKKVKERYNELNEGGVNNE